MNHHTQGRTRLANSSSSFEGIYTLEASLVRSLLHLENWIRENEESLNESLSTLISCVMRRSREKRRTMKDRFRPVD